MATPVNLKLVVAVPPMYRSRNGAALLPKSMLVVPGSRLVLRLTETRLDRLVLAPPPPPRQLPILRQTVPVELGIVMVALATGLAKTKLLVKAPLTELRLVVALPCNVRFWPVLPIVKLAPGVIAVREVRLVMSELAPLAAAPRLLRAPKAVVEPVPPKPTLTVPLLMLLPFKLVRSVPLMAGS